MNRVLIVAIVAALSLASLPVSAETVKNNLNVLDCGVVQRRNTSDQFGPNAWVMYVVETQGYINLCGQFIVAVEAYVSGVPNSGRASGFKLLTASVSRQVPVPRFGTWTTVGRHWATTSFWPKALDLGMTTSRARVEYQEPDPQQACYDMGWWWDPSTGTCQAVNSPIILDTARNGYRLTSVDGGVRFDLDADGSPELVAWTRQDGDDAFLAMDRNGNGRIDDGSELFGNNTPVYADRRDVTADNGFDALAFLDSPSATYGTTIGDGVIDAQDAAFGRLLIWRDANHNGISEPEELQPAAESGLAAIGTDYTLKRRVDRHGNQFRQRGRLQWADGRHAAVFDIWLVTRE